MIRKTTVIVVALTTLAIFAGSTGKAVEFKLVSESAILDPTDGHIDFTLEFNQPPDFTTVDSYDRQAHSFQYFMIGQPDLHYPDIYDAIVRGEEIHLTGDEIRIRGVSPSDPMPGSGGWGAIRESVPFNVSGSTLTFSASFSALSDHGLHGNLAFHWETYDYGGFSSSGNSQTVLKSGWSLWQGGNVSAPTNWSTSANWFPADVPNGAGSRVAFGYEDSSNDIVDMISSGRTVGSISFNELTSTTIRSSGGYALTLNNNGSTSMINVAGSHTITAPVLMNNDATITGDGILNLSGGISGHHALTVLGNLTASSINVSTLTIGSSGAAAVPEPSILVMFGMGVLVASGTSIACRSGSRGRSPDDEHFLTACRYVGSKKGGSKKGDITDNASSQ